MKTALMRRNRKLNIVIARALIRRCNKVRINNSSKLMRAKEVIIQVSLNHAIHF